MNETALIRRELVEMFRKAVHDTPDHMIAPVANMFRSLMPLTEIDTERSELDVLRIEQRAAAIAAAWFTYDEDEWNQTLWAPLSCADCETEALELAREIAGVLF